MSGPISFGYQNLGFGGGSALDPGQLVFIQKSTVSASSSVDMTDVFTTDYGMYLLQYTHFFSAEDTGNLEIKFFNASVFVSGSSYNWVANEMKSNANVTVTAKECRNNNERMIRKFCKKVKKERIVEEHRERKYYEKPSEVKRKLKKRMKVEHLRFLLFRCLIQRAF